MLTNNFLQNVIYIHGAFLVSAYTYAKIPSLTNYNEDACCAAAASATRQEDVLGLGFFYTSVILYIFSII